MSVVVVQLKRYDYDQDEPVLLRGISLVLKESETVESLKRKLCSRFELGDTAQVGLLRESESGEEELIEDIDQIMDKDEIEVFVCEEALQSDESKEVENKSLEKSDEILSTCFISFDKFAKSCSWEVMLEKDSPFARLESEDGIRVCMFKQLLPSSSVSALSIDWHKELLSETWIVILCHGGRFAIAEYQVKSGKRVSQRSLARYVSRKKQGKRQANHDKSSHARSVGSMMRRHHEKMLKEEITMQLDLWSLKLVHADKIFVHAPGDNRKDLEIGDGLKDKVRSIPVMTRVANLPECDFVFKKLTTLQIQKFQVRST